MEAIKKSAEKIQNPHNKTLNEFTAINDSSASPLHSTELSGNTECGETDIISTTNDPAILQKMQEVASKLKTNPIPF